MKVDLNKPEYYVNRELSWLKFNLRVLREAGGTKYAPSGAHALCVYLRQ